EPVFSVGGFCRRLLSFLFLADRPGLRPVAGDTSFILALGLARSWREVGGFARTRADHRQRQQGAGREDAGNKFSLPHRHTSNKRPEPPNWRSRLHSARRHWATSRKRRAETIDCTEPHERERRALFDP